MKRGSKGGGGRKVMETRQGMGWQWSRGEGLPGRLVPLLLVMLCCCLNAAASAAANEHDGGVLTTVTLSGITTTEVSATTEFGK